MAVIAAVAGVFAYLAKWPCRYGGAWSDGNQQFVQLCYTDVYPLYFQRGLADGRIPYLEHELEYPVGIGAVMHAISWLVSPLADTISRGELFYDLTTLLMAVSLVAGVLAVAVLIGAAHKWYAVWFAVAAIPTAYINWDLFTGALALGAFVCWAQRRHLGAGILLGLAIATKFYPLVFLGPLFLLTLRTAGARGMLPGAGMTGEGRAFWTLTGGAAATWLVVNLPVMAVRFDEWARFYQFSSERPADWGSLWYFFQQSGWPILGDADSLNVLGMGSFLLLCVGIALLALSAPVRPRLMQLCFLVLAAFMLTNKVWSPQYVLWLLPFAVLARPRWRPLLLWQAAELWYFVAIWWYLVSLNQGMEHFFSPGAYFSAVLLRALTVVILAAFVVRDILRPDSDVVRAKGVDDPAGGVFDRATDRFTLRSTLIGPRALRGVAESRALAARDV